MTFGDEMKRKADEVHLQDKAKDFGDAVAELVKAAVGMVGSFAAENREKVEGALDKAEAKLDENTHGKHAEKVSKVRAQVDKGIDALVDQRDKVAGAPPRSGTKSPAGSEWPHTPVPDDVHSAFDDNDIDLPPKLASGIGSEGGAQGAGAAGAGDTEDDDETAPEGSPS